MPQNTRIIIVGTSGAGKTTLARQIAQKTNRTHIELDSIWWGENWTPIDYEAFKSQLFQKIEDAQNGWVIDGNYSRVRPLLWQQADTIIWLDYPRWLIYWRVLTRTIRRVFTRQKLWGKNHETFRNSFLSKDSILMWAHTSYSKNKERYTKLSQSPEYAHLTFIRLTSPQATKAYLNSLTPAPIDP